MNSQILQHREDKVLKNYVFFSTLINDIIMSNIWLKWGFVLDRILVPNIIDYIVHYRGQTRPWKRIMSYQIRTQWMLQDINYSNFDLT